MADVCPRPLSVDDRPFQLSGAARFLAKSGLSHLTLLGDFLFQPFDSLGDGFQHLFHPAVLTTAAKLPVSP
jgi:hypothetical protein